MAPRAFASMHLEEAYELEIAAGDCADVHGPSATDPRFERIGTWLMAAERRLINANVHTILSSMLVIC